MTKNSWEIILIKGDNKTWQQNAIHDPELGSGTEGGNATKGIIETTDKF